MFDIDLQALKEAIFQQAAKDHQQALNLCHEQILTDDSLSEKEKQVRLVSLQNISNAVLALNVTVKLMEENNKALWNKLVELGVVKNETE